MVVLSIVLVIGAVASSENVLDKIEGNYFSSQGYFVYCNGATVVKDFKVTFDAREVQHFELSRAFSYGGYDVKVQFCAGDIYDDFDFGVSTFYESIGKDCSDSFLIEKSENGFDFSIPQTTSLITALESCYGKGNVSVPEKVMTYNDYNFALVVTSGDGKARFAIRFNFNYLTESVDISNERGEKKIIWINGKE